MRNICLAASLVCLTLGACGDPLKEQVDQHFPPINRTEEALKSLEASKATLAGLKNQNVLISLAESDLEGSIASVLAKEVPEVKDPKLSFGPQRILLEAKLDKTFTDQNIRVKGDVEGYAIVSTDPTDVVLTPIFNSIKVRELDYKSNKTADVLAPILNAALDKFIDNVNGQIKPVKVSLNLSHSFMFDLAEEIRKVPGVIQVEAPKIDLTLTLAGASILVDNDAIRALGAMVAGADNPTPAEMLETCQGPPPAAGAEREGFERACQSILAARAEPVQTNAIQDRTDAGFEREFKVFRTAVLNAGLAMLGEGTQMPQTSYVVISKSFLASTLNSTFADPAIHVVMTVKPPIQEFHNDIRLEKSPDLKCTQNERPCNIDDHCQRGSCDGWPCNYDCKWYQADCHGRKLGCEINKAAVLQACNTEQDIKYGACQTSERLKKLDCERLKVMERVGCKANQDWLNYWSEKKLGHVNGKIHVEGKIDGLLNSLKIADDFTSIDVGMALTGVASIAADLQLVPANEGHLACQAKWNGRVNAAAIFTDQDLSVSGGIRFENPAGDKPARLVFAIPEREVEVQVAPPPFFALTSQNPDLAVSCAPAVLVENIRSTISSLLGDNPPPEITGRYKQKVGPFDPDVKVQPIKIVLPGNEPAEQRTLSLVPTFFPKAIGFTL